MNRHVWTTLREAVRGTRQDFTQLPVGRSVVLLSVPMVLEMLMESVFVIADIFFVGRLGADAIATVGITESLMTIIYATAIGLSIGATATVARRIGEHDADGAARATVQAITLGIAVAAIVGTTGALWASELLGVMGASPDVIRTGATFARVMLGGSGTVLLLFLINAAFRGAGDAAIAMRVLWFANAINIALGPCLIFGLGPFPELGVTGAAVGTTIGRGCGVLYQLYHLTQRSGRIVVTRSHLGPDPAVMSAILRLSGTAMVQNLIGTASWMGLIRILTGFGSAAVAGNTIAIRIILFALLRRSASATRRRRWSARTSAPAGPTAPRQRPGVPAGTTRSFSAASAWSFCCSRRRSSPPSRTIPQSRRMGSAACRSCRPDFCSTAMAWC
jgi:Na+-driven multidrug efflux pump